MAGESWRRYWFRDPLIGALYTALYHGLRMLPLAGASAVGAALGAAEGRYRHVAASHRAAQVLARLRPELTPEACAATVREMWRHVGRTHAEMAVIDRLRDRAEIKIENAQVLEPARRSGRPVVFVFPHLGNWELLAVTAQRLGFTLHVVYETLANRFELRLATRSRRRLGYRLLAPDRDGMRRMLAALARGEAVGLAIDEYRGGNVVGPTFGRPPPARWNIGYALKLARRYDAALLAGYCLRTGPLSFTVHVVDPGPAPDAAALDAACEAWIRDHPEQWYMLWRLSL